MVGLAGTVSVVRFAAKGPSGQVPDGIEPARKARSSWQRFKPHPGLPSWADDEEPARAA
ncbi:hypothetical protein ACFRAA_31525 [[Kitasatospora] papulosa]|uniref:hypothetical protein n=1 Tax=Streptomyces TaxID=1883 RepID=UPI0033B8BDC3